MSREESVLCTSSSLPAVTLGRLELWSVWEGEQLQQLEWCRLLQSCCWRLQCSLMQAHAGLRVSRAEMRGHLKQLSGSAGGVGFLQAGLCGSCEVGWVCRFPGVFRGSGVGLLPSKWDSLTRHN